MRRFPRSGWPLCVAVLSALLPVGCVAPDLGFESAEYREAGAGLSSEQRWHVRKAAEAGEHELIATVSRMAWDNPNEATAFVRYATALRPDSAVPLKSAVARLTPRD